MTDVKERIADELENVTPMLQWVLDDLVDQETDGTMENLQTFIHDLLMYGGKYGQISNLTYSQDTAEFFDTFKKEINNLLWEKGIDVRNFSWYEPSDQLFIEPYNLDRLVWFIYETCARSIASVLANIDIDDE